MGMVMLQVLSLALIVCAFACSLVFHGSAVPPVGHHVSNSNTLISIAPTPVPQPNGRGLHMPLVMPPPDSAPAPQIAKGQPSFPWPSPSTPPTNPFVPPPTPIRSFVPTMPPGPSFMVQVPAPILSPPSSSPPNERIPPTVPEYAPPNSRQTKAPINNAPLSAIAPVSNVPAPWGMAEPPLSSHSVSPEEPPSLPPDVPTSPALPSNPSPQVPILSEPPSSDSSPPVPFISPKVSPSGLSPRTPKMPQLPPMQALPPLPPRKDCVPMTCTEPYAYGPLESPCACVLPIQVGLHLTVALYTFFPLVAELASETATGVFMKQSQVRIIGANAAEDNPDKTIVLIDLLPLGQKFDDTTVNFTFQRFWQKQVVIKTSLFGDYDVLYVRYPGLPPSPPLSPSTIGIITSKPYPGRNNPKAMKPLGVDVSGKQQKHEFSGSIVATIILSCFAAVFLLCAVAWVFLFQYRHCVFQPDPTPSITIPSLAKSSGIQLSMVGSRTSSPSFSLGSSMAAYTGSAKTFSSSDIEKATDFFNEARILGEGGFGRVYNGVLEDGTKVAVKILKRYDQQGGREFLAEVEMLSRLHHRNLVKLIGICVEDHTRCLVYELIPNDSLESHLHGCDKGRSPLDWSARLKIALGAARALAYLHEDSSPRVIHRDFKASNILLEDDFTPKVSDFGLARTALDGENRYISTRVMGTFGYVAPEYAMTGHLLVKSDVYSYGVVLLELLTGRKPVDMSQPPGQESLVSWARPFLTSSEGLESIIDQSLAPNSSSFDGISKVAAIASMCVQPEVSHRPFMGEVVQALKLVCNECDEIKELPSRSSTQEDMSIVMEVRNSTNSDRLPAPLLSPSTFSDYDYRLDVERDLYISELLSPEGKFGGQDSESFRRHSSSGPLRTGKAKPVWKKMRHLSRGSVSEHGVLFKLWPGSH